MKVIRSISILFLATLILLSSTSFVVGVHFCMGRVQSIALYTKAESCKKVQELPPCHRHQKPACCSDETIIHDGDDFNASSSQLVIATPVLTDLTPSTSILIAEVIPDSQLSRIQFHPYDPPLRSFDLLVEHQVFLI